MTRTELFDEVRKVEVPVTSVRFKDRYRERDVRCESLQSLSYDLDQHELQYKDGLCFIPDVGNPYVTGELHTIGFAEEKFRSYYEISKCTIKGSTCVFEYVGN